MLEKLYRAIWKKLGGRPWTYIIRDTWARYEIIWIVGLMMVGAVLGHYFEIKQVLVGLAVFAFGVIFGHIFWGTKYIAGQKGEEINEDYDMP